MWPSEGRAWKTWCGMMYKIRNVTPADLAAVTELEAACFSPATAAGEKAFAYRIQTFPERFFVAEENGRIIGMVNGCASSLPVIEDRLYGPQGHEPDGKNQMIFGLAVLPEFQGRGIGTALMNHLIGFCRETAMEKLILTCRDCRVSYYERFGYVNCGLSASTHGGVEWYDMILELK